MAESNKIPNWTPGKALEKSNFAQTCSLLSQFLKEKRTIGVGISGNKPDTKETFRAPTTTKNFLTNMENQAGTSTQNGPVSVAAAAASSSPMVKSPNFFHQLVSNIEDSNKPDLRKTTTTMTTTTTTTKSETAPMTIFYAGQVLVFNDLPFDKAEEVIALARKGSSNVNGSVSVTVSTPVKDKNIDSANVVININDSPEPEESNIINTTSVPKSDPIINNKFQTPEQIQERPAEPANGSDLPIARRNSLHRFFEKRKDRVAAKAPYQVNRPVVASPKPADEGNQEGECSEQLELKLW